MKNYKIFTIEEFNQRVHFFWDLMIKSEFPEWECVPIEISKRMSRTYAYAEATYLTNNRDSLVPSKFKFSHRMLDGRFTLESVVTNIKHEICHQIAVLRYGINCGHDYRWKNIMVEFGLEPNRTNNYPMSEIGDIAVRNEARYHLVCECGKIYKSKSKKWWVKNMIRHHKPYLACKDCNKDDSFTLYIFPDGIKTTSPEIDYEAYANLVGGKIIRKEKK